MDRIRKYNPDASYEPNGGRYLQIMNAKDLLKLTKPNIEPNEKHKQDVKPNIKSNKELKHDTNKITYEEEKVALILGTTAVFTVWWMFK